MILCAHCGTEVVRIPTRCPVCYPAIPAIEGEPDRAEMIEAIADRCGGVMGDVGGTFLATSLDRQGALWRYTFKLDGVERMDPADGSDQS